MGAPAADLDLIRGYDACVGAEYFLERLEDGPFSARGGADEHDQVVVPLGVRKGRAYAPLDVLPFLVIGNAVLDDGETLR